MSIDTIGVIAAIFFGSCAMAISIWQGWETRQNYRLSVTPNINIVGYWRKCSDLIGISLENKGIGPAIITKLEIEVDGKNINILQGPKELQIVLAKISSLTGINILNYYSMENKEVIAANEKQPIFWIDDNEKNDAEKIKNLRQFFFATPVTVEYKSIYGKTFYSKNYHGSPEIDNIIHYP